MQEEILSMCLRANTLEQQMEQSVFHCWEGLCLFGRCVEVQFGISGSCLLLSSNGFLRLSPSRYFSSSSFCSFADRRIPEPGGHVLSVASI